MLNIRQLSQELGIGTDTLRVWERRYGFPQPQRNARGQRVYPARQVEELRLIRRLQDLGLRPGRIFALSPADRRALLAEAVSGQATPGAGELVPVQFLKEMPPEAIDRELRKRLASMGLSSFILHFAAPLLQVMDRGWTDGRLSIAREHLISDRMEHLLLEQLDKENPPDNPLMLFLTLSGERHKLGLLLAAALFHEEGMNCLWIREDLPLAEVPQLARDVSAAAVAISFSAHYSSRQAKQDLALLRNTLEASVKLFVGGHAVRKRVSLPNLIVCPDLAKIPALCRKHFRQEGA